MQQQPPWNSPSDSGANPARPQDVKSFDLTRSPMGVQAKPATLALIDDRTSVLCGQELGNLLHKSVEVVVVDGGASKFRDFVETLEEPGCICYLEVEALGGHAMLAIERRLLFMLLEHLFGGGQAAAESEESVTVGRPRFSPIEERIIRRIVHLFGRSLESAWRPVIPLVVRHLRVETKPMNAAITPAGEWVVTTTFLVSLKGQQGYLKFALPASLLDPYKERLTSGAYEEKDRPDQAWQSHLSEVLGTVPVELVAELGRTQQTLRNILGWKVGDVLRLDQPANRPVALTLEGIPKYLGDVTVHFGNLAVELRSLHDANYHRRPSEDPHER